MTHRDRVVHGLLLAAILVAVLPGAWPPAILVGWTLAGIGLALAMRHDQAHPWAPLPLALLVAFVALSLVGTGATIGRGGAGFSVRALDELAMIASLVSLWLPAGVFAMMRGRDAPGRFARAGVYLILGWIMLFAGILVVEARTGRLLGEAHMLVGAPGALLVTIALAWRVARPVAPAAAPVSTGR